MHRRRFAGGSRPLIAATLGIATLGIAALAWILFAPGTGESRTATNGGPLERGAQAPDAGPSRATSPGSANESTAAPVAVASAAGRSAALEALLRELRAAERAGAEGLFYDRASEIAPRLASAIAEAGGAGESLVAEVLSDVDEAGPVRGAVALAAGSAAERWHPLLVRLAGRAEDRWVREGAALGLARAAADLGEEPLYHLRDYFQGFRASAVPSWDLALRPGRCGSEDDLLLFAELDDVPVLRELFVLAAGRAVDLDANVRGYCLAHGIAASDPGEGIAQAAIWVLARARTSMTEALVAAAEDALDGQTIRGTRLLEALLRARPGPHVARAALGAASDPDLVSPERAGLLLELGAALAAEELADVREELAWDLAALALEDEAPLVRSTALEALVDSAPRQAVGVAKTLLRHDAAARLRFEAAALLPRAADGAEALRILSGAFASEKDERVRRRIVRAIAELGADLALPWLRRVAAEARDGLRCEIERRIEEL